MNNAEAIVRLTPQVFKLNGVPVRIVDQPVITAGSIAVKLALTRPNRAQIMAALQMARPLEAVLNRAGASNIRVTWHAGRVLVEAPLIRETVHISRLTAQPGGLPIGLSMDGHTVRFTFDDETPHLLVLGPTGAGKTTLVRALLYNLHDVPVAVLALKRKSWTGVQGATLLTDKDDISAFGRWLKAEMYGRAKTGEDAPVIVVMDDVLNLLGMVNLPIDEYASLGRETGIHLILTSQRAGEAAGGAAVTGNITSRVVFGTASALDASTMTGRAGTGAERLAKWRALLVTLDETVHFQAAYLGRDEIVTSLPVTGWDMFSSKNVTDDNNEADNGNEVTERELKKKRQDEQIKELLHRGVGRDEIYRTVFGGRNNYYKQRIDAIERQLQTAGA